MAFIYLLIFFFFFFFFPQDIPPLSPLPVLRSHTSSPRRVSSKHSVYISPHKSGAVMTPNKMMKYCFSRSPAKVRWFNWYALFCCFLSKKISFSFYLKIDILCTYLYIICVCHVFNYLYIYTNVTAYLSICIIGSLLDCILCIKGKTSSPKKGVS